jgi:serine/threonine protein kinase
MITNLCPNHDTLEAYLLGKLDVSRDESIDAHLDTCTDCQVVVDRLDVAINQPFACLREPAQAIVEWHEPAYQQMVAQAKALAASSGNGASTLTEVAFTRQTIGNYLLLEPLGSGGMGKVFKARHQRLKKTVAVKLLTPSLLRSADARRRFQREIEAVGRLTSPHIVTAYDAGEADGHDFLVMEYVEGKNLADVIKEQGPLPIAQALDYILQAARGLDHAHAVGIIHRDVKPSNLLLDHSGTVKVLDLGLARVRFDEGDTTPDGMTGNVIMGTVAYMAPEQAINTHHADERAGVYSLGCTLYFLLTGKPPYEGKTPVEMLVAHREQPIPSLCAVRPDCPDVLDGWLGRMMAKKPQDRPASMRKVIDVLDAYLSGAPVRTLVNPSLTSWRGLMTVSVAACLLVLFALWSVGRLPGDPEKKQEDTAKKSDELVKVITPPKKGAVPEIDLVPIPPGTFMMGGSDSDPNAHDSEKPRLEVKINRAFLLGKTEITQAQYQEVMGKNPSAFSANGQFKTRVKNVGTSNHPVENVSWIDAIRFCIRLSERHELKPYYEIIKKEGEEVVTIKGGDGYRLPTEAEWEYACRGGMKTTWYFGESLADLKDHAWFGQNSGDHTHPVGQKKANPFGLYDMYGNVAEWCWDRFDADYYKRRPNSDPPGSGTGRYRVFRGDGWNSLLPRTSARQGLGMHYGGFGSPNIIGFRVARNAEP